MTNQFNQLQEKRRSIYALGKNVKKDKQTLVDLIEKTIELSPSAFNSQTVRAVIAFGKIPIEFGISYWLSCAKS